MILTKHKKMIRKFYHFMSKIVNEDNTLKRTNMMHKSYLISTADIFNIDIENICTQNVIKFIQEKNV